LSKEGKKGFPVFHIVCILFAFLSALYPPLTIILIMLFIFIIAARVFSPYSVGMTITSLDWLGEPLFEENFPSVVMGADPLRKSEEYKNNVIGLKLLAVITVIFLSYGLILMFLDQYLTEFFNILFNGFSDSFIVRFIKYFLIYEILYYIPVIMTQVLLLRGDQCILNIARRYTLYRYGVLMDIEVSGMRGRYGYGYMYSIKTTFLPIKDIACYEYNSTRRFIDLRTVKRVKFRLYTERVNELRDKLQSIGIYDCSVKHLMIQQPRVFQQPGIKDFKPPGLNPIS